MNESSSNIVNPNLNEEIKRASQVLDNCRKEVGKRIVGQKDMINGLLMGILAGGHVLLEGVPGLAKTLAIKTLAEVIDAGFRRIQFTPDLLPADLVGTMIYRQQTGEFLPRKGPVFTNIILADEVNRAPAKVQSALLEAMEERQVTIGENTYPLPDPFFVLATQNPIEHEGTYPLPEAQLDRFLLKIKVGYPGKDEEISILRRVGNNEVINVNKILFQPDIRRLKKTVEDIAVDERIEEYIVSIIRSTREENKHINNYSRYIEYGASPRATVFLFRCAKVHALFDNRAYVVPEDVKAVAPEILRHRIVLSYEAESDELFPDDIIKNILSTVPVP
ncbi:MAG: AAA family ATPase [Spirochaetia bacterium]